ncbi:MAG TPA: beta-ketoacyl-ACP synthase II, partial [Phycisphaerae bacterium]|nr:beta-ketoacyl-ACP synthase II [Phycisphaerae bacterium]
PSKIGGEVKDFSGPPESVMLAHEAKKLDWFAQFAVAASAEAVKDCGIDFDTIDRNRCGVIVGSGIGGLQTLQEQHRRMLDKGPTKSSPFTVPRLMGNAAGAHIAILFGLGGPNFGCVTACASAAHSIGQAMRAIQNNEADLIITGGSEAALCEIGMSSFCALKGLSTRNDDPQHASRPWDADRDGFLLAEGAGCITIEELEFAKARGARIYAELIGYGATCDASHITAPDPEGKGAVRAMEICLADAGLAPAELDYINAHGTSTQLGDRAEITAIKKVFGDHATNGLLVSSTKSLTGHLLGASGGVEIIACVKAIQEGIVPGTYNLNNPDEACEGMDLVPNAPRKKAIKTALSNSFGFGGHNGCLIIRKYEE